jgi:hypothetical protein
MHYKFHYNCFIQIPDENSLQVALRAAGWRVVLATATPPAGSRGYLASSTSFSCPSPTATAYRTSRFCFHRWYRSIFWQLEPAWAICENNGSKIYERERHDPNCHTATWVRVAETTQKQENAFYKHRIWWQWHIYDSSGIHAASCLFLRHSPPSSVRKERKGQKEENIVFPLNAMKAYGGGRRIAPFTPHLDMEVGG